MAQELANKTTKSKMQERISMASTWAFVGICLITNVLLVAIAVLNPLTAQYTLADRWGFITMSLAGTIGSLLAMLTADGVIVRGLSILAIELYLFGLVFQLLAVISHG